MESVKDKVVLITGASSGIGAGTAVLFAKYGAQLTLVGRNTANLLKVVDECHQWGLPKEKILPVTADLTKSADLVKTVEETVKKFQQIDVLVNNAGIAIFHTVEDTSMEEVDQLFDINVKVPIHLTKLAAPYLKKTKGCIINVSSDNGLRADVMLGVYSMTKAALDMFTSTMALEFATSGVRVNSVNPGDIRTPIHGKGGVTDTEKYYEEMGKLYPAGRVGLPHEVANAIVYLASDAASFVNGVKLPVDGGISQTASWYQLSKAAAEEPKPTT